MKLDHLKIELIKSAEAKLQMHKNMGSNSKLSIFDVAKLFDIVCGNVDELDNHQPQFIGLHSLN